MAEAKFLDIEERAQIINKIINIFAEYELQYCDALVILEWTVGALRNQKVQFSAD